MTTKKSTPGFVPSIYKIFIGQDIKLVRLEITGQKFGVPNKRIVLDQKGLKVKTAQLTYRQKNKQMQYQVTRINHLPSFEQVRLHTDSPLYPGNYQINIEFGPPNRQKLQQLEGVSLVGTALRQFLPSFDNEEARSNAKIELTN